MLTCGMERQTNEILISYCIPIVLLLLVSLFNNLHIYYLNPLYTANDPKNKK